MHKGEIPIVGPQPFSNREGSTCDTQPLPKPENYFAFPAENLISKSFLWSLWSGKGKGSRFMCTTKWLFSRRRLRVPYLEQLQSAVGEGTTVADEIGMMETETMPLHTVYIVGVRIRLPRVTLGFIDWQFVDWELWMIVREIVSSRKWLCISAE